MPVWCSPEFLTEISEHCSAREATEMRVGGVTCIDVVGRSGGRSAASDFMEETEKAEAGTGGGRRSRGRQCRSSREGEFWFVGFRTDQYTLPCVKKIRKQNRGPSIRDSAEAHGLAWAVDQLHRLKLKHRGRNFKK
jgi:hypothetical protein